MEFSELITVRRSVRNYKEAVPYEDLVRILTQAQQAPSWKNLQASRCYVAQTPEFLEEFRSGILPEFNQKSSANAALIVTTFVKDQSGFTKGQADNEAGNLWGAYDLGLHDAYLVLAASDAGYDTLIMGLRNSGKIREFMSIPENEEIMSVIAVGKRVQDVQPKAHKEFADVVTFY